MEGVLLDEFVGVSLLDCGKLCLEYGSCVSINYNRNLNFCQLNHNYSTDFKYRDEDGFIYSEKSNWNKNLLDEPCSSAACSKGYKCNRNGSVVNTCVRAECGLYSSTHHDSNVIVSGDGIAVGRNRELTCTEDVDKNWKNKFSVCKANGEWTKPIFDCQRVTCNAPPKIPRTTISGTGNTTGSTRVYSCDTGYPRETALKTSVCSDKGEWSSVSLECKNCSTFHATFERKPNYLFHPPGYTPSYSSVSLTVDKCANMCRKRGDFVCVAFYYKKTSGNYCEVRGIRVHDDPSYEQYYGPSQDFDEYIRICQG